MPTSDPTPPPSAPPRQLLVYEFPADSQLGGHLVGALERIESGGAMRILDALFVIREGNTEEFAAVSIAADGAAGMIGRLLSFRLDAHARAGATRRALQSRSGPLVRSVAARLEPGAAVLVLLVEHAWMEALADAIDRAGGRPSINTVVEPTEISEAWPA